jgi:hypothetical protein
MAKEAGVANAFDFPGFVPAYIRPLFCRGIGPFRWVALSGDPEDIAKTDAKVKELIPDNPHLHNWLDMAAEKIKFQGLPARICWVGLGDRDRLGLAFNEMVKTGELKGPIVIGRDHLDSGSVASPNRETEAMRDGSDAVSDWPLLNALLSTASGATWVSLHHGGGVGMGFSQHAGLVIVCDGTDAAAKRIGRVLCSGRWLLWTLEGTLLGRPLLQLLRHRSLGCLGLTPRGCLSWSFVGLHVPVILRRGRRHSALLTLRLGSCRHLCIVLLVIPRRRLLLLRLLRRHPLRAAHPRGRLELLLARVCEPLAVRRLVLRG